MAEPKTPTKNGDDSEKKAPTPSEAMFFFAIVKHTKNKADIDWDGVALEQGFKNAGVAKVRFGQVKRKLGIDSSTPKKETAASSPAKVKKAPARRAGAKGGRKKNVKKEEETDEDEDMKTGDCDSDGTAVKDEMDPEAQLQADMDAMINPDPF